MHIKPPYCMTSDFTHFFTGTCGDNLHISAGISLIGNLLSYKYEVEIVHCFGQMKYWRGAKGGQAAALNLFQ